MPPMISGSVEDLMADVANSLFRIEFSARKIQQAVEILDLFLTYEPSEATSKFSVIEV